MAHAQTRIPRKDNEFNQYINNTTVVLLAVGPPEGYVRLGLTVQEKDDWVAGRDAWNIVYPQFTDLGQRTKSITAQKNTVKNDFIDFATPLLDKIAISANLTLQDRDTFNLPVPDTTPTPRGNIEDVPIVGIKPIGGGQLKVRVRQDEDASRASRHPLADGLEFKGCIIDPADQSAKIPSSPDECPKSHISKKALFNLELGAANSGKRIYFYVRWINLSNPANSGPWTEQGQSFIL